MRGSRGCLVHGRAVSCPQTARGLYYEISGDGELLVLVPAGIADSSMWDGQLAAFARRYRVIRYDMRGFGRSAMVEGPFSHHEDSRALLDSLSIERAFLVGCSIGGRAIIDFALEHPELVRALVPVGSALSGFDAGEEPPEIPQSSGRSCSRLKTRGTWGGLRARGPDLGRWSLPRSGWGGFGRAGSRKGG